MSAARDAWDALIDYADVALPLQHTDQATAEWLTRVLYEAGSLKAGGVTHVACTVNTTYHAQTARLQVAYSGPEAEGLPTQLFLKCLGEDKGKREVEVYRQLLSLPRYPAFAVPCYATLYDTASGFSSLLLSDMSETHSEVSSRAEVRAFSASPPLGQLEQVVTTLAHGHALGWAFAGTAHLPATPSGLYTDEESYQSYAAYCHESWRRFVQAEPALAAEVESLYLPLVEGLPQLWHTRLARRFATRTNLTLVHGDCSFSQFLYPRTGEGQTFLIDFDSVRLDLPTDDLALLTTFWQREARSAFEPSILRHYHHALCRAGITTYTWAAFLEDYRISLLQHAMYPIFSSLKGDDKTFWRLRLSAITVAYTHWDCAEFLASGSP